MNKINYQKCLEETIAKETKAGRVPALFLHSCCAPCSSYVLEYLSNYFKITVFYYNPNIYPDEELTGKNKDLDVTGVNAQYTGEHKPVKKKGDTSTNE